MKYLLLVAFLHWILSLILFLFDLRIPTTMLPDDQLQQIILGTSEFVFGRYSLSRVFVGDVDPNMAADRHSVFTLLLNSLASAAVLYGGLILLCPPLRHANPSPVAESGKCSPTAMVFRGRMLFVAIVAVIVSFQLALVTLVLVPQGNFGYPDLVRLLLTAGLLYLLWRGFRWAKWITVVLCSITLILFVAWLFTGQLEFNLISGWLAVIAATVPAILIFSSSLNAFFSHQRNLKS